MNGAEPKPLPPYAYVPGGPWPHPISSPQGHSYGQRISHVEPIRGEGWRDSHVYLRGIRLFNAGYYWEAHEVWESLWHAHGRRGPTADLLKALIKLAASGVKVRERQPHGVAIHARRAADLLAQVRQAVGSTDLGLDLLALETIARRIADVPPLDPEGSDARVSRVFSFQIEPR